MKNSDKKKKKKRISWYRSFNSGSRKEKFVTTGTDGAAKSGSVDVRMMHVTAAFRVAQLDECHARAIELPLAENQQEMVVFLPNGDSDVARLEKALLQDFRLKWNGLVDRLERALYHVTLPQFDVETTSSARSKSLLVN